MEQSEIDLQEEEEENDEIKLIEEYHEKIEDYKNQADGKEKLLRNLRSENDVLQRNFDEESKVLKEKALLCEKLKRDLKNLEKENINLQKKSKLSPSELHAERMRLAKNGKNQYVTIKEQRKDELKTIMQHGRKVKKHKEWLSNELGNTIENFNEMFISNLSLSLTQIFVDKDKKKEIESKEKQDLSEEGEEEEEEGDHIYEVEVVGQQVEDRKKALQIDNNIDIGADQNVEEEKVDPNAEDNINQAILQNQEAQVKDKEMADQLNEQEKAVIKIEGSLLERERLLKAVKESHCLMQNTLLEEMRNEYFKKVKEMEYEITKLKSDHKLSIRSASTTDKSNLESNYKNKLTQLEQKMKHYKVKEKEQKKIEKECVKQSNKIKALENDVQKMRNQKISLNRKFKEHEEKYK